MPTRTGASHRATAWVTSAWVPVAALGFAVLPVLGLFRVAGPTLEEGIMLYLPERVAAGDVPNVDFLYLYGPGSLHALAGWYEVFGDHLGAERWFGLLQYLGVVGALYVLARPWGRFTSLSAAAIAALVVAPTGVLVALPWLGALALLLWATVLAVRAGAAPDPTGHRREWFLAAALAGLAVSFRPDIALAAVLVLGASAARHTRRVASPVLLGGATGLLPVWVHLAIAGPAAVWEGLVVDPIVRLRPGRRLPIPPSWDELEVGLARVVDQLGEPWVLPAPSSSQQVALWFWAMVVLAVGLPLHGFLRHRAGPDRRSLTLLVTGLLALGVVGQGLQRPDPTHLAWVTVVSWPGLVLALSDLLQRRGRTPPWAGAAAGLAVGAVLVGLLPTSTAQAFTKLARIGLRIDPGSLAVESGDRHFFVAGNRDVYQQAVDDLAAWSRPGESLLVGPNDLSRTVYNDSMFYWLLPDLEPATYYVEMDPGLADRPGSGLADEVREADWLLLTSFWSGWDEPNASSEHGSPVPNEVVADRFCLVGRYGGSGSAPPWIMILRQCGPGNGVGVLPPDIDWTTPLDRLHRVDPPA